MLKGTKEERDKIWEDTINDIKAKPFRSFLTFFMYFSIAYTLIVSFGHLERATMYCDTGYGYGVEYTKEQIESGNIPQYEEMKFTDMVEKCKDGSCEANFNYVCKHDIPRWLDEIGI